MLAYLTLLPLLASMVLATPVPDASVALDKRYNQQCGQYETTSINANYELEQNLWGKDAGSGSSCSQVLSASGNSVGWTTTYQWSGGQYNVKSYTNIKLLTNRGRPVSQVKSMPSSWSWTYDTSTNLVADVSYDIWLSRTSNAIPSGPDSVVEIMVWLSTRGGAAPAGSTVGDVSVAGKNWTLWKGKVGAQDVYSFVSKQGEITSFSADLKLFVNYLTQNKGVSTGLYLTDIQAGTEPFTGGATLRTTSYSAAINL